MLFIKKKDVPLLKVMALNKPEWYFILFGCIGALVTGAIQPVFSIVFSKLVSVSKIIYSNKHYVKIN